MISTKEAVLAVTKNSADYEEAKDYYDGDVPETFATSRLRAAFKQTGDRSRLNFCRTIVHAVSNRLEIGHITGGSEKATAIINKVWESNDLGLEADDVHRMACALGDYYAMVWPDKDGEWQVTFQSPKNAAIIYDPMNMRRKLYGVQLWRSGDNEHRMNIFTKDKVFKYRTNSGMLTENLLWTLQETLDNPFGDIPMFHFRTHRPQGRPEHYDAYDGQNAINKLFITNMHTIDYHGAPVRYALSNGGDGELADFDEDETDRENMGTLKNGPGELWYLQGVSKVGEFKPADSNAFWGPIKETLRSMAVVSDTPLHFFERTGNNPTGNGLRTAEAPLLKKVQDRQRMFGYAWRDLFRFILQAENVKHEVVVYWKANESLDELERWDVSLKKINAGLSHAQALREGGYTDEQIKQIMKERDEEARAGQYYQRKPEARVNIERDENHEGND